MVNYQAPPAIDIAPWGWNPAATFQASFLAAEENRRAQEKMAMEQELYKILLPEKIAKTEFNLKELAYASKMMERSYRAQSADLDARYRAATSSGSGASSNVAGNGGSSNQAQSRYGGGVANMVQNYLQGGAVPSGGGGGGKILGQGHTGDDY